MTLEDAIADAAAYCKTKAPEEACGFILLQNDEYTFSAKDNVSIGVRTHHFAIASKDVAEAMQTGSLYAVVHSHTSDTGEFSPMDIESQKRQGIPWILIDLYSMCRS